jgi:DNA polymerase elongation subunit (family B)
MTARGWLIDLYVREDIIVLWFRLQSGSLLCLTDSFPYLFYAQGRPRDLLALEKNLSYLIRRTNWTKRRDFWTGNLIQVRELEVFSFKKLFEIQKVLSRFTGAINFYNIDLAVPQYYAYLKGLFPLCYCQLKWEERRLLGVEVLDSPWNPDAELPPFKTIELGLTQDPQIALERGNSIELTVEGRSFELGGSRPADLLEKLNGYLKNLDPDLIISRKGDDRILPILWNWSQKEKIPLALDRDPHPPFRQKVGQWRSYFSYGQIIYQSSTFPLYGRFHIDQSNSFFYREAGLQGLLFISRLTKIPVQTLARSSPGTAITSMQLDRAISKGILIPWKKGRPEDFKTAWDLLVADKGGLVFQPPIGLRENVAEIDFASMYPNIMVKHNISPETMLCSCCPDPVVPETGYNICHKRKGLIPETLSPILDLRAELKARVKANHPLKDTYQSFQKALKWILVTCFGYTGYKNARFGRIEAHEAITAFGRDKLFMAKECAEARGYRVLHCLTDSLWIEGPGLTEAGIKDLLTEVGMKSKVPINLEGIYHWIIFLPSNVNANRPVPNRYFGLFQDGSIKTRGIACCRHDIPPFIKETQTDLLLVMGTAHDRKSLESKLPEILDHLGDYVARLKEGRVETQELVITRRLTRKLEEYRVKTPSAMALEQFEEVGLTLHPGQKVGYLMRDSDISGEDRRILPAPFLQGGEDYDKKKYLEILLKAAAEVLVTFGLDYKELVRRY